MKDRIGDREEKTKRKENKGKRNKKDQHIEDHCAQLSSHEKDNRFYIYLI